MNKLLMLLIISGLIISGCVPSNPCEQKVKCSGNCLKAIMGYEFDSENRVCIEKTLGGCTCSSPFSSLEECQSTCEN